MIEIITYTRAKITDMAEMAEIHTKCFEDYFLTSFGNELIAKYYEEFFLEDNLFVIAHDENNDIIGFAMGYIHGSGAKARFEKKYSGRLIKNLLIRCLKLEKLALKKCFGRGLSIISGAMKKNTPSQEDSKKTEGELLSICVLPKWRGHNVAQNLIKQYEELLLEKNITYYSLTVHSDNKRASCFYEKCGFVKKSENKEEAVYSKNI